jgi:DNA/RNA endonuclease YhcR with UshA esterase domain
VSFGDDDLAMMLGDAFSVPVTFGVTTTSGIVGYHDLVLFDEDGSARVVGRERAVTLATSVCSTITNGLAITVNGASYTVRGQPVAVEDGAKSLVYLRG